MRPVSPLSLEVDCECSYNEVLSTLNLQILKPIFSARAAAAVLACCCACKEGDSGTKKASRLEVGCLWANSGSV